MSKTIKLEQIQITQPCTADWRSMAGDQHARFCDSCQKHVFDLSAHSRHDSERIIAEHAGKLCVRMTMDRHGNVITQDGPKTWPLIRRVWPVLSLFFASVFGLSGCMGAAVPPDRKLIGVPLLSTQPASPTDSKVVMGDFEPTPRSQPTSKPSP